MIIEWLKRKFDSAIESIGYKAIETKVVQEIHAVVIRACTKCGAAGVDSSGKDVGKVCPKCFAPRPKVENLGRIWKKERRI